ncbi:MAG TPA: NAD-binding protein [Capsulimonadaceae bacterium]|nr:NAD-binding protein [Capsulimonadaceae bacterium]
MTRIGFIGLGRMGRPMAANLQRKGFALTFYDINPSAAGALSELGARALGSVADVARASDIVITMVPGSAELRAVVLGPDGILANGRSGQILMDMSTVEPQTKLVNNYLAVVSCQLNAEALALAQRLGLNLEKTLEVINGTTAYNGQLRVNWPSKVLVGDISPGFTMDLAHKDLSLILSAANAARVPMPLAAAAREMFSLARAGAYAQADFSAMVDVLCEAAGIEKPRLAKPLS